MAEPAMKTIGLSLQRSVDTLRWELDKLCLANYESKTPTKSRDRIAYDNVMHCES